MKKALLTLAAVMVSVSVFAQGTIVFNNLGGKAVKWDPTISVLPNLPAGITPGANVAGGATGPLPILVQLLWDNNGAWEPVGDPVSAWPLAGTFNGGQRQVARANTADPGFNWRIVAWAASFGSAYPAGYDASLVKQVFNGTVGQPVAFMSKTGDPVASISPQGMAGAIPTFTIGAVPEPSVIALGVLGVGALLLLRRRS